MERGATVIIPVEKNGILYSVKVPSKGTWGHEQTCDVAKAVGLKVDRYLEFAVRCNGKVTRVERKDMERLLSTVHAFKADDVLLVCGQHIFA